MHRLAIGWQSVGNRLAIGWQSVGERLAIGWRKAGNRLAKGGKVLQIFSDHIAIESPIIAEYSLIQFVPG
jgi:hypothetical protein